jgi:hypothetical protein
MLYKNTVIILIGLISITTSILWSEWRRPNVAFVDTKLVLDSFQPAIRSNELVKKESERILKDQKIIEDKIANYVQIITKEYDAASLPQKKIYQDSLAVLNQELNQFKGVNQRKLQEFAQKQMADVLSQVNAFLVEYGQAENYDIIFGTTNGSVIYGTGTKLDITKQVSVALNEKFP